MPLRVNSALVWLIALAVSPAVAEDWPPPDQRLRRAGNTDERISGLQRNPEPGRVLRILAAALALCSWSLSVCPCA